MINRLFCLLLLTASFSPAAEKKILVYTRNFTPDGKGYVHDNIQTSVDAIKEIGAAIGFKVDSSADPKVFHGDNLKQYKVLVFDNSNNEAFENDAQREVFKRFIQAGGGYVGIHVATGSERNWPYYQAVAGGKFVRHPKLQPFTVTVKDASNPATKDLPASFEWEDECYLHENLNPDIKVLLTTDPAKIVDPGKPRYPGVAIPLAWYHTYDGGREIFIALGHKKEHYANPIMRKFISGAILWAAGEKK